MKRAAVHLPLRRQNGAGIAEIMIAMTIGLVLLGGVGYLFVGSKQMNSTQSDLIRMQESARNAMDAVGRAVRQAGYRLDVAQPLAEVALDGSDGGGSADEPQPDTLIVYHDPNWVDDEDNPLLGRERNCEGVEVVSNNAPDLVTGASPVNTSMVAYRFFVSNSALRCSAAPDDTAAAGVLVANHIENFQVTYGVKSGSETIGQYTATPDDAQLAATAAVRVSVLVRGSTPRLVAGGTQTLQFGDQEMRFSDGFLRQVYTTTFTVRNQSR